VGAEPADIDRQALRLALGAELTHRAGRCAGGRVPAEAQAADLRALAARLAEIAPPVERAHGLRFEPAFPGVTAGVEELRDARRLLLACTAFDASGELAAVVFTTVISGRPVQVSAAPAGAPIPEAWGAP
jgi:hypothetical protein